ncbi:galactose-1-phosphate uridylyltransferase [Paenibacillus chitinolyticus]|uniref:Galactose-1-phosphate uridylyltransferase n=5 Tax=Paenibacillus chitinolyticus TaxID=79263 RepID=A0A410WPB3_9BACL|nr:UDP-glucose--hexose-1-phosphate uridylyltransferase [Paenibacillus chitinolyticus]MCY9590744.1 UDP-glucose--hexose-1-phosphate uridylyltransferase [Paenibacillus chitinolyticus]QAV16191.1 galactose-1-phosphate uridylyltransferase [Paenibacillus chitinolyticus]
MSMDLEREKARNQADQAALAVERLVSFALAKGMIESLDVCAARNALLDALGLPEPYQGADGNAVDETVAAEPGEMLEVLLDFAYFRGRLEEDSTTYRDLFDARLMGLLMPRPSEVARQFGEITREHGVRKAADWFYELCINSNYIRMDRIRKNGYWLAPTEYGNLEITVNLSKPEKDPKEIALLRTLKQSGYPQCLLCVDNVGYAGRLDHPARQNLRVLPLTIDGEAWFFQYSPYVYYNEHCIVLNEKHVPMKISERTFRRLFDFIEQIPHYFVGSNADLPIVGGSILSHDHFQGGNHKFPMELAPVERKFASDTHPGVTVGIVRWPMSVLRLEGSGREDVLRAADMLLAAWRAYSDPSADIAAFTQTADGVRVPHNTVTPIARFNASGQYELDLVLRNNRASEEHPDGIFHPHRNLHHIKKENIGLIEVMGLAVLPGRLQEEISGIAGFLTGDSAWSGADGLEAGHPLEKHAAWIGELVAAGGTALSLQEAHELLQREIGGKFKQVLEDAGVFKRTDAGQTAFGRFLGSLGFVHAE